MLDKKATRRHFELAADTYDAAAVLQREVAKRLCERQDYIKISPGRVLDAGCGTGFLTKDLIKRYKSSDIIALDFAHSMVKKSQQQGSWLRKPKAVVADAEHLPLKSQSIDLIVSSLMLQWCNNLEDVFSGFHRVLAPNGLILFTTFGPDTLKELRHCWSEVDQQAHTSQFADMHEIGDALLKSGFVNPVTDMEMITMTYSNVRQLLGDIKGIGASNTHQDRARGLTGKKRFKQFEAAYEQFKNSDDLYPATWEIIYGHAWVGEGLKIEGFDNVIQIHKISE